ncbi:hypothetical protein AJ79_08000 [Helicocarpus griseus UAMH5409]|uniref:F-box domain-containing protein n=1 Tax=Helicocarpus griseus UAMH5409 TaxID=1447875 RepID=A0A2B7WX16_9EURO|nr:hypothetical protein AJ79_08000 [Helicocarpus griseus UAMH5409]
MIFLDSLAPEIMLEIVSYLTSATDLLSLGLQCRRFYYLTAPLLRTVWPLHRLRLTGDQELCNTYQLLVKVLRNRRLGLFVEHMEIDAPLTGTTYAARESYRMWANEMEGEGIKLVESAIDGIDFTEAGDDLEDKWRDLLERLMRVLLKYGHEEFDIAAATLFMKLCPDIRHLKITSRSSTLLLPLLRPLTSSPQFNYLQNLRHVDLFGPYWFDIMSTLGVLLCCLSSPSIESAHIDKLCSRQYVPFNPPSTASNITKLHLTTCHIPHRLLIEIIKVARALVEFRLDTRNAYQFPDCNRLIYPRGLAEALRAHKTTLRVLDIDADERGEYYVEAPGFDTAIVIEDDCKRAGTRVRRYLADLSRKSIGLLHDFPALTHLGIGVRFLMGPNADEVRFYDCDEERVGCGGLEYGNNSSNSSKNKGIGSRGTLVLCRCRPIANWLIDCRRILCLCVYMGTGMGMGKGGRACFLS